MKTKLKYSAIITIAALIALALMACGNGAETNTGAFIPQPFTDTNAAELVADMKVGWSLGNTLDCYDLGWLGGSPSVSAMETAWGNPVTKQENFDALKNAGFNTVRIPVSWAKCTDKENYTIRANWIKRVKDVVDYAARNDMYIILNTHHDEEIFKFMDTDTEESLKAFRKMWEQIAAAFKDYDEKLIFEGLNEPRTKGSAKEWQGGTPEEHNNLNTHYQVFVDTVRASGGNNGKRLLLLNTYAASGEQTAMAGLKIPNDTAENKIIVSYHAYAPYNFALNTNKTFNTWSKNNPGDTSPITTPVDHAYNLFVSNGIPVVIGEFGAMNKGNADVRAEWAEFYVGYAKSKGMPCVWWDNGVTTGSGELFGLLNRRNSTFSYPEIVAALMRGAGRNEE